MLFLSNVSLNNYKSLFIFYLIISANFVANIFGCSARKLFADNMIIKHLIGFFTLYYFVVLEDPYKDTDNDQYIYFKKIGITILIYLIFLISSRTKDNYFITFLILLIIIFFLNNYINSLNQITYKSRIDTINTIINYISIVSICVILVGFILYYFEKKKQYINSFNYITFLLGTKECKHAKI
jgi:hypothetical protein